MSRLLGAPFCASVLLLWSQVAPCAAAIEPIDADGPDFVESSEVAPRGRFQVEVDGVWLRAREGGTSSSTPTLIKYGFREDWELRIAPEGLVREEGVRGAGDTAIGLKWHSHDRDAEKGTPAVSWILHFDLPTGARAVRETGVRTSLRPVLTWDLPHEMSLGVMPGVAIERDDAGRRYASGILGIVAGKRLSETVRAFVELAGERFTSSRHGGSIAQWDVGAAWLLGTETQLGFRAGVGANDRSPARSLLLEIAQRF